MTFAITGATSMLGAAAIKACIKQNVNVVAFCRPNSKSISHIPQSKLVQIIECDLSAMSEFSAAELRADVFIHFGWAFTDKAGRNDCSAQLKNVSYTLDAVHLAQRLGCKKFIGAGSQAEYGVPNVALKENTPVNPVVPYGVAKYAAGKLSKMECSKLGMEHIWVRILSTYGSIDSEQTLISQLVKNAKANAPMALSACGQTWDYLFEDDAGRAFVAIAQKGKNGRVYNLGSGIGRKLKDFVEDVVKIVNPNYKPEYGKLPYSPTQPMRLTADISPLVADTGWKPEITFKDGINKIIRGGGV